MAFIVNNRFPADNIGRQAVGVDLPFSAPAVFRSNYFTKDAIKNNLINFFSTNQGERVFNPFFGSGLQRFVYENISGLTDGLIRQLIQNEINAFFPFVTLNDILVQPNADENTILIKIYYSVTNFGITDSINVVV
jgi:phage baseplate assembly protein W